MKDGKAGATKSENEPVHKKRLPKLEIQVMPFDRYGGKLWVKILFPKLEWVPSFEDLFWILKALSLCENEKYPPDNGYKGWRMVAEFAADACQPGADFEKLRDKFKIPDRSKE